MFTGIIQAVGKIGAVSPNSGGVRIGLDSGGLDLNGVKLGDSIAVNGACLTVVGLAAPRLAFDVSRETLACVAGFTAGAPGNLEKALRVGDGLDGHGRRDRDGGRARAGGLAGDEAGHDDDATDDEEQDEGDGGLVHNGQKGWTAGAKGGCDC